MLQHCVFLNFDESHSAADRMAVLAELGGLQSRIDGFVDYRFGPNLDFEAKSPEFSHGFICSFRDRAALMAYAAHPLHVELGARLVAMCKGGAAGILVFDLETAP